MNRGEQIYQIKQALRKLFTSTEESIKEDTEMEKREFSDYELEDGTKLTSPSSTLEVGADVFGINLDGNQYPLDNGDYKLTDGRVVSVEDNKIKSISEPAKTEESPVTDADLGKVKKMEEEGEVIVEEKEEEKMEIEIEDDENNSEERIAKIEEVLAKVLIAIDEINKAHSEMMGSIKKFSEEPATESIKMERGIGSAIDPKEFAKRKNMAELDELRNLIKLSRKENNNTKI